jgi:hypothetical protein
MAYHRSKFIMLRLCLKNISFALVVMIVASLVSDGSRRFRPVHSGATAATVPSRADRGSLPLSSDTPSYLHAPARGPIVPVQKAEYPAKPVAGSRIDIWGSRSDYRSGGSSSVLYVGNRFIRASWNAIDVEGGIMSLSWGNTRGSGPLDVVSPLDYSNVTRPHFLSRKVTQPMLYAAYRPDSKTRIEAVFVPYFAGNQQISKTGTNPTLYREIGTLAERMNVSRTDVSVDYPDTSSFEYAQYGARLSGSVGPFSLGLQTYVGNMSDPAITAVSSEPGKALNVTLGYNRYTQIGANAETTVGDCAVRSELAANITGDFDGTDGSVYNPSILWLAGCTKKIGHLDVDLQGSGSVRLMNDRIGSDPVDTEAGTDRTHTRISFSVSRKMTVLDDEIRISGISRIGLEDRDCYIVPAVGFDHDDFQFDLVCGIFAGNPDSEFGQYSDQDYLKLTLTKKY